MYNDHFYTNWFNSVLSDLQVQAELISHFPTSVVSDLQAQAELISNALNALPKSTMEYFRSLAPYYNQLSTIDFANQMTEACSSICNAIKFPTPLQGSFDFLKNLNLQDDFIDLTDNDCDSINAILGTPDISEDAPTNISKGKMAMADFIKSVLIPILAIVLPMLLTIYYHKVESIESQKRYIEELQLKEKELQLKEEELRIKEQQLQNDIAEKELLESILIEFQNQSGCCESPELPDEAPEPFGEVPHSPDGTQDNDLSNPEVSKSSETAMYKE